MSSPLSVREIRDLIDKLELLEKWQSEVDSTASSSQNKGYSRGDPKARAAAARPSVPEVLFPAIPQIARNWKLSEEAGLPYSGQLPSCVRINEKVSSESIFASLQVFGLVWHLRLSRSSFLLLSCRVLQSTPLFCVLLDLGALLDLIPRRTLHPFVPSLQVRVGLHTGLPLSRSCTGASTFQAMLNRDRLRSASQGDPSLLVLTVPSFASAVHDEVDVFAIPVEFRQGGMLLAIPTDVLSEDTLAAGQAGSEEVMFGPNSIFAVGLIEESEDLMSVVTLDAEAQVVVVDVTNDILSACREYDPVTDSHAAIMGFSLDHPNSIPEAGCLFAVVNEWLLSRTDDRTGFYSAQEDQVPVPKDPKAQGTAVPSQAKKTQPPKRITNAMIAEQLGAMNAQLLLLSQRQDRLEKAGTTSAEVAPGQFAGQTSKLPAVSARLQNPSGVSQTVAAKALNLLGPPPKVRNLQPALNAGGAAQDEPYDVLQSGPEELLGVAAALTQQSSAITALVAHLTAQGGDVLGDFTSAGNQSGSIRGVQRREKMQNELAGGTSNFFNQLMQQLHRRLHPSKPLPQSEEETFSVSMLQYLERQGGYRHNREMGLVAWVLGHAIDAAAQGDLRHTREVLALLMVAVEQSVLDRGDWTLAYMLTLMEEPPLQMFQERTVNMVHQTRPFGPLCPPQWTAVCLSYLKDMEVLNSKKTETAKKAAKPSTPVGAPSSSGEPEGEVSPKRKPRFPKKPKAKSVQEA